MFGLKDDAWSYIDAGLIHGKHKSITNTIAIWDILVRDNEWLIGTTYQARYKQIAACASGSFMIKLGKSEFDFGLRLTDNIFIPRIYTDYQEAWDVVTAANEAVGWKEPTMKVSYGEPVLEGIVLKNPNGILEAGHKEKNNTTWYSRCRVRTGRHRF